MSPLSDNLFDSNECAKFIQGGRMAFYKHNNKDGLLFTTASVKYDQVNNNFIHFNF